IGASIGGLYAVGYTPKELERFAVQTNWTEILGLDDEARRTDRRVYQKDQDDAILSLRFNGFLEPVLPKGLSNGQRWTMLLNSMVINAPYGIPSDFLRQTRVPFIAVATDIIAGRRRLMTSGDLTAAIRASATWPIMFNPVVSDSSILVDGGLISNVPVDVAKVAGAATVVAVNASSGLKRREDIQNPWDVADQAVTLMMLRQTQADLANADIIITPDIYSNEFDSIASMIEAGRVAARQMLERLRFVTSAGNPALTEDTLLPQLLQLRVYGIDVADSLHTIPLLRNGRSILRSNVHSLLEDPIIRLARSRGLSLAQIDSVVFIPRSGRADVFVDPGVVRSITLEGAPKVHPDVVYREFPFSEGDAFTASGAERGIQNLIGTEIFEFVGLEIVQTGPPDSVKYITRDTPGQYTSSTAKPSWDIKLTVQPKAANVLRLGVLADNEFGTQFWSEFANENVLGSATNFSLKGHLGPQSRRLAMTFNAPRLFRTNATFLLQAYTGYKDIPEYNTVVDFERDVIVSDPGRSVRESKDWGARIRSGGQVGRIAALTAEYRYEQQRSFTIPERTNLELLRVGTIRADLVYDTRDDRAYPTEGTYLTASAEAATEFLGSEIGFTKLSGIAEQTISLSHLHKLIPRVSAGFGDLTLPRQEQFALGGIESFYGLNEYEMRGRQMLTANLTYQIGIPHALFFPTFVAFRYDMGSTWLIPQAIKFEALVHGIGVQVGLKTPFGLARFGIGENFRFVSNGDRPVYFNRPRFYFSIGSLTY
ncbi:MAG TPA: BamA/TamA family outer membrane protein, partial [Candidatus Kapabacteria bacterium]|nr:BamA/TamA family outer membrane protein [Candidatus Kapabacteria bacterium]